MKKITYHGVNPQVVATAKTFAQNIIISLQLPQYEMEDLTQRLVIEGILIEREFVEGEYSLSSYLTERMHYVQLDLMRTYLADKRKVRLSQLKNNEWEDEDGNLGSIFDFLPDKSTSNDIIGISHLHGVLEALSPQERELAELLLQGYTTNEAAEMMGLKPRFVELLRAKIRKNHKNLKS